MPQVRFGGVIVVVVVVVVVVVAVVVVVVVVRHSDHIFGEAANMPTFLKLKVVWHAKSIKDEIINDLNYHRAYQFYYV